MQFSRPWPQRRPLLAVAVTAAVVPALVLTAWVYTAPRTQWSLRAADDWRARGNDEVGAWFHARRIDHPRLYVMCASAGMYASAAAVPGYPYLWFTEVRHGHHAEPLLVSYLSDARRGPEFVAVVQRPDACDPTGAAAEVLAQRFRLAGSAGPIAILERVPVASALGSDPPRTQP